MVGGRSGRSLRLVCILEWRCGYVGRYGGENRLVWRLYFGDE